MDWVRTAAQRISYSEADRAAAALPARTAFVGDQRDERTAAKRQDDADVWNQRSHATTRIEQRFGVAIDIMRFVEIGQRIETGEVIQPRLILIDHVAADKLGRRSSMWLPWIDDLEVPLVCDHDTRSVVTVLPLDGTKLYFDRCSKRFPHLANGETRAARTYRAEVRS